MSLSPSFTYLDTNSSELPARYRYEAWLTPMVYGFEVLPPDIKQKQDFKGRIRSLITDTGEIHDVDTDSFSGFLSEKSARSLEYDKLALIYVASGTIKARYKNDVDIVSKQNNFLLFDASLANDMQFINARFIQLNLPRFAAQNYLTNYYAPSQLSRMVSNSGLASLLGSQLSGFYNLSACLSNAERLAFLQNTENLALSALNCLPNGDTDFDKVDKNSTFLAAVRYIEKNLALDSLSIESVAMALGCSRSTLYRAFAAKDLFPADYIRDQRLQKLAHLLQYSAQYLTIAQLASECGLYDAPNLSRLFKRKFGLSPQEYRAHYTQ